MPEYQLMENNKLLVDVLFHTLQSRLNVSSQRGMVERLEVFSPPLLCSIHTVVFLIAILFVRFDIDVSGALFFSIHTVSLAPCC